MALSNKSSKLIDKQPTHVRTFQRNGKTYWVDGTERRGETWYVSIREEHGHKWWWIPYLDSF
jgi:hypothetical protein